ncbi:MAG: aldehyde dehydrogenase (NADP(+)) [Trueperaceae bacterium]|nr:MAG: aldehyde dehydrogenase (NADP(+)) [Trueperaceae bacterium]
MHGGHIIEGKAVTPGAKTFDAIAPATGQPLGPAFAEGGAAEADAALRAAAAAFEPYRALPPADRARFLRRIATEIEALGGTLIERTMHETALPEGRLQGERGRTTGQLRMFADLLEDGSWVGARIDRADPSRSPLPKPDLRRSAVPLGPVVVFGASNFPYAFSTAGGDTASALAAGCPVVVKAHPAHPGTGELVAIAIAAAAAAEGVPAGVFAHLQGSSHELGRALVTHDLTAAVGFTGSLRAGRALFDAAAQRPRPIPVYAEMGSVNPVFVLPGALAERAEAIAEGLVASATLGVGQFCTNPGLVITVDGEHTQRFLDAAARAAAAVQPATMLYPGVCHAFREGVERFASVQGVDVVGRSSTDADPASNDAGAWVLSTDAETFRSNRQLADEVFGPSTLIVRARDVDELEALVHELDGQLTVSVHATTADLAAHPGLVRAAERIAGRIVFGAFPTGVEVTHAMQHGGPYPATTDARSTSVGTAAIERFVRPVTYQDAPDAVLPPELRDDNPLGIWRLVDGRLTRDALA